MSSPLISICILLLATGNSLQQLNHFHMGGRRNIYSASLRTSTWARLHLANPCRSAAPFRTDREPRMSVLDLNGRELTLLALARIARAMVRTIRSKMVSVIIVNVHKELGLVLEFSLDIV